MCLILAFLAFFFFTAVPATVLLITLTALCLFIAGIELSSLIGTVDKNASTCWGFSLAASSLRSNLPVGILRVLPEVATRKKEFS